MAHPRMNTIADNVWHGGGAGVCPGVIGPDTVVGAFADRFPAAETY